ncbi:longifolia [Ancistrocladus abbreviatus]
MTREKQRNSSESPRASTSSGTSTFSSLEYNQKGQVESSSFHRNLYHETTPLVFRMNHVNSSPCLSRQTHHQNSSTDSTHICKPSTKMPTGMQVENHSIKHIDSPRPFHRCTMDKQRISALHESLNPVITHQNVPLTSVTDKNRLSALKVAPRLSYDERDLRYCSKSSSKLKELPRLSLDSREQAITGSTSRRKDLVPRDLQREGSLQGKNDNLQQEPGSHRPLSNIVVKLMGLEALPDSTTKGGQIQPDRSKICDNPKIFSRSSTSIDERKLSQVPESPRKFQKDPNSPQMKNNNDSATKPKLTSRISLEPAPWKQSEEPPGTGKSTSKHQEGNTDTQNLSISIYSEIEKRLTEIDFKKSGKDLRALKQILESMQRTRSKLSATKENQGFDSATRGRNSGSHYVSPNHGLVALKCHNQGTNCSMASTSIESRSLKDTVSPVVTIKPDKLIKNSGKLPNFVIRDETMSNIPNLQRLRAHQSADGKGHSPKKKTPKDLPSDNPHSREPSCQTTVAIDKSSRVRTNSTKTPKLTGDISKDNISCPGKSTETVSSKLLQRSLRLENHHHIPTLSSDSGRAKCHVGPQRGSGSPTGKVGQKSINCQLPHKVIARVTRRGQQGNVHPQSDSCNIMVSTIDPEVKNPSGLRNGTLQTEDKRENPEADVSKGSITELTTAVPEQPSPVSVLDAPFYEDQSPSPVKKKSFAFTDVGTSVSAEAEQKPLQINHLPINRRVSFNSESDYYDLETFKHIAQQLWQLKSTEDRNQDSLLSIYKDLGSVEERYVFDILFVSGFLGDLNINLSDNCVQQTTQAINPKLFLILEQIQGSMYLSDNESSSKDVNYITRLKYKHQRRLIFDVANEIMVQKLHFKGSYAQSLGFSSRLAGFGTSGQQLFRELGAEIDRLQANSFNNSLDDEEDFLTSIIMNDLMHKSAPWTDVSSEISGLVLDIERLIFKDLIAELVHSKIEDLLLHKRRH